MHIGTNLIHKLNAIVDLLLGYGLRVCCMYMRAIGLLRWLPATK